MCTCRYVAYANVHLGMCYHGWTELSRSTGEILYWFAHKWSKDFKEKFPSANSGFTKYEFRNLQHESLNPTRCRIEYIGG